MVQAKIKLFNAETQECAAYFRALSHPARITILRYLADTKTCITGDISDLLPLSRSTVSQHLAELKKSKLIQGHIEGVYTKYCLNPKAIRSLKEISSELFDHIDMPENFTC